MARPEPAAETKRKRRLPTSLWVAVSAFAAVCLVFFAVLQLDATRRYLVNQILSGLNVEGEREIAIDKLGGTWPFGITLKRLTVADSDGVWLSVPKVTLEWRLLDLLFGQMQFEQIDVREPVWHRMPKSEESDGGFEMPSLPDLPFELHLDNVDIVNASLERDVLGTPVKFDLEGAATLTADTARTELHVSRDDSTLGDIHLIFDYNGPKRRLLIDGTARDGGKGQPGLLAMALDRADLSPFRLSIRGDGPPDNWRGSVSADIDGNRVVAADVGLKWADALELTAAVEADLPPALSPRIGAVDIGKATANLTLHRSQDDRFVIDELAIDAAPLKLHAASFDPGSDAFALRGEVDGLSAVFPEVEPLGGHMRFECTSSPAGEVDRRAVSGWVEDQAGLVLNFDGEVDTTTFEFVGKADVTSRDEALLQHFLPQAGPARASLAMDFARLAPGPAVDASFVGELIPQAAEDAERPLWIGSGATVSGGMSFVDEVLSLSAVKADYDNGTAAIDGDFRFDLKSTQASARGSAQVADLTRLAPVLAVPVSGALGVRLELEGPLAAASYAVEADASDLVVSGLELGRVNGSVTLEDEAAAGRTGKALLTIEGPAGEADLRTDLALAGEAISFQKISGRLFGVDTKGQAVLAAPHYRPAGQFRLIATDLSTLQGISGLGLVGSAQALLRLSPAKLDISATGADVALDGTAVGALSLDAVASLEEDQSLNAKAGLDGVVVGPLRLSDLTLVVDGALPAYQWDIQAQTQMAAGPATISAAGDIRNEQSAWSMRVGSAALDTPQTDYLLGEPVEIALAPSVDWTPVRLVTDPSGGELSVARDLNAPSRVTVNASRFPLAPGLELAGMGAFPLSLNGQARLGGSDGNLDIELVEDTGRFGGASATINAEWSGSRMSANAALAQAEAGLFEIRASMSQLVSGDFVPTLGENTAIDATLNGEADVAQLWRLSGLQEHDLSGTLTADMRATGALSAVRLSGEAAMTNGRYESLELGTLLTDIELQTASFGRGNFGFNVTARDGGDGTLAGDGVVSLGATGGPALTLDLRLDEATLVRRDEVTAQASGTVDIDVDDDTALIRGKLTANRVEGRLPDTLPPEVVVFKIDRQSADGTEASPPAEQKLLKLDVAVAFPGQVFVRGRGLDSEWSGNLKVTGNADEPAVSGKLSLRRGNYTFAGKTFELSEGTLTFDGSSDIDPTIYVKAVREEEGLTAYVTLSGRTSAPVIDITSSPSLPRDEILAVLLFGKSKGKLSPLEAVQLADAVSGFSGGQGALGDMFGQLRSGLGIDVLSVEPGTGSATDASLTVGKYLEEDVYVGVSQGLSPGSGTVTVEIELDDSWSVETEVRETGAASSGLNWKWDY